MLLRGYLTRDQLDALLPGARIIDEDGDTLERTPDGRWVVVAVPDDAERDRLGDVWPTHLLRARRYPTGR